MESIWLISLVLFLVFIWFGHLDCLTRSKVSLWLMYQVSGDHWFSNDGQWNPGFLWCTSDVTRGEQGKWAAWSPAHVWIRAVPHLPVLYIGIRQQSSFEKSFSFTKKILENSCIEALPCCLLLSFLNKNPPMGKTEMKANTKSAPEALQWFTITIVINGISLTMPHWGLWRRRNKSQGMSNSLHLQLQLLLPVLESK